MDDDMIKHAAYEGMGISYEEGWVQYKLKHQCTLSCAQLLDKFWNEIRPNLKDCNCVKSDPFLLNMIETIPSPKQLREAAEKNPIEPIDEGRIQLKAFPQAYEEEAARKMKMRSTHDDVLGIRNNAISVISYFQSGGSPRATRSGASRQSAEIRYSSVGSSNETLPALRKSVLPNT